jgi:hypothetical protein
MKKYRTEFTAKNLTGNAGLLNLGKFAEKIGLKSMLERHLTIKRRTNAKYSPADAVMMLIMGVLAGAKHISHMGMLRADGVIRALFGWEEFPTDRTFGRLFRLFGQKGCHQLSEVEALARKKVWSKKWFGRITLDMDSTVRGVNGSQEGAAKGYNPKKKGQKSYHPLLCFIAESRECLHSWFRTGSAYTANGAVEFMKECFSGLPQRVWKVFVRADSAFFSGELLDFLEERSSQYLIKVKMKNLNALLMSCTWRKAKNKPGVETAQFIYKCLEWKKERRFVAVRKLIAEDTEGLLYPMPQYEQFCYVTNLELTPWECHSLYGKRSTSENWVEWCKNQMASGSILTQEFWANSALFQTCILAYNLMVWMMRLTAEEGFKQEPNTIRDWLVRTPASLIRTARKCILKLPRDYVFKEQWEHIERSIESISFA